MKKGQITEGWIERVEFPNRGIMAVDGHRIAVSNTVPGQKVRIQITKARKGRCEGRVLEILEHAPQECAPDCPHFGQCGGCVYRNLPYEAQLKLKETQVKELLQAVCPELPFEGIKPSPSLPAYRNKMEFTFGDAWKDGPLALGMHRRGSFYDIVTVDQCRIVDPDFRLILKCVLEIAGKSGLTYFHRGTHEGYFRHLLVRKAWKTGEILVDLVTSSQIEPQQETAFLKDYTDAMLSLPLAGKLTGVLHTINDRIADIIASDRTDVLWGQDYFCEELLGLTFRITPFSFFQTNSAGAEVLYETVREYIGDTNGKVVFDLYSGTGTIAQILAGVARSVTGVEIVEEAVEAARENSARNGLDNCSFIAGDVLKVLDTLPEKPDLIILDPPRDGIHPKALPQIIRYGVERIVYVSCKPTSLSRDLVILQQAGYRVERCCCVDMFPGTQHVETVVCLGKKKSNDYVEIGVDAEDYYRIKDSGKDRK